MLVVSCCLMPAAPAQDDAGHARVIGLAEKKEELYLLRVEVQGFEGLVVEGMQELLRRKAVRPALLIPACADMAACCEGTQKEPPLWNSYPARAASLTVIFCLGCRCPPVGLVGRF